jgi:broad specificity phosphatase PhoE
MNNTGSCTFVTDVHQYEDLGDYLLFTFCTLSLGGLFVWLLGIIFNTDPRVSVLANRGEIPPFDVKDEYYDTPHNVCGGAKVRHRVILVRHGESAHNKRHDGRDGESVKGTPSLDTGLTVDGQMQAEDVARFLSEFDWHPDVIRVSPMLRARQTSAPFLRRRVCKQDLDTINNEPYRRHIVETNKGTLTHFIPDGTCIEVNVWGQQPLELMGHVTNKETYGDFVRRVVRWRKELEADAEAWREGRRMQTLVFTHSMVISEFLNTLVSENRGNLTDDDWSNVYWQVNHGSVTCVDYMDNGEWHIQAMNYTKHITHYTGLKSPLV